VLPEGRQPRGLTGSCLAARSSHQSSETIRIGTLECPVFNLGGMHANAADATCSKSNLR
jgi:hypothetical protein